MSKERLYLFDTTLRDGAQTTGVDFSVEDKRRIAAVLDELGVDYVEGGFPGANATDTQFLGEPSKLKSAKLTAFGMTKRVGPLGLQRSRFAGGVEFARRRHLPRHQVVGLPRARRARHLQRGEPRRRSSSP